MEFPPEILVMLEKIGSLKCRLFTNQFRYVRISVAFNPISRRLRSQNAEFLCFDATGEQGAAAPGTLESRGIKIRDILPLYKYPYEGFDIRSLESSPQQINLGLEIKLPDGFM